MFGIIRIRTISTINMVFTLNRALFSSWFTAIVSGKVHIIGGLKKKKYEKIQRKKSNFQQWKRWRAQ